jgi:threonine synthase
MVCQPDGLPVHRLICASNRNKILSDFIRTADMTAGVNSCDELTLDGYSDFQQPGAAAVRTVCRNSETVREWMNDLREQGAYEIDQESLKKLQMLFVGGYCDEKGTLRMIRMSTTGRII